jgi:hypothetical protein
MSGVFYFADDMDKPSYYAVITADVRYDKNLSASEKLFFAEITALTQMNGRCYASNSYFAELYDVARSTISLWVSNLAKSGYVSITLVYEGKSVAGRYITINERSNEGGQISEQVVRKSEGGGQKIGGGWSENQKDNTTLTESNTTPTESNKRERFLAPSVEQVFEIMGDKKQSEMFVAFYASKGWVVGKAQMKDWKSAVRGWMARNGMKPATNGQKLYGDSI